MCVQAPAWDGTIHCIWTGSVAKGIQLLLDIYSNVGVLRAMVWMGQLDTDISCPSLHTLAHWLHILYIYGLGTSVCLFRQFGSEPARPTFNNSS